MIRVVEFSADLVRRCDTAPLERLLASLERNPQDVREVQGTMVPTFPDHEDAEVVYLVPEVKQLLRQVYARLTHLLYYLAPEPEYGNLAMFLAVHTPEEELSIRQGAVVLPEHEEALALLGQRLADTANFADRMADDTERILERLIQPLPARTGRRLLAVVTELRKKGG